jgi:hypothetical protein
MEPQLSSHPRVERGVGRLTVLFFGTVVSAIVFCGYNVVPFFYYYFELTNQLEALVVSKDRMNDAALRKRIMAVVNELEIPADERDIRIDRRDGSIEVSLPYKEIFYFRFRGRDIDIYTFSFIARAHGLM